MGQSLGIGALFQNPCFLQVCKFWYCPALFLHSARWEELPSEVFALQPKISTAVWNRCCSAWLLSAHDLEKDDLWDCVQSVDSDHWMLSMCSEKVLAKLWQLVGATVIASRLRAFVRREDVLQIREALGAEGAMVLRSEAWSLGEHLQEKTLSELLDSLEYIGQLVWVQALTDAPISLRSRAGFRVPLFSKDALSQFAPVSAVEARETCCQVLSKVDDRWCSCFPLIPSQEN